jgi:hypothetical protein
MRNFGVHSDPANKGSWTDVASSKGIGLILRSIKVDYKFVSYLYYLFSLGEEESSFKLWLTAMHSP